MEYLVGDGNLIVQTSKHPQIYSRWLGVIYKDGINLNEAMVAAGHAVYSSYGK